MKGDQVKELYMEIIEILKMGLKEKLVPAFYPQTHTAVGSYWNDWQRVTEPASFNMCLQTNFWFFKEVITEDGDFYLHPNRSDFCRETEYLKTRLGETKE